MDIFGITAPLITEQLEAQVKLQTITDLVTHIDGMNTTWTFKNSVGDEIELQGLREGYAFLRGVGTATHQIAGILREKGYAI